MPSTDALIVHSNYPKLNAYTILDKGVTMYQNGTRHRMWQNYKEKRFSIAWGSDPERVVWEEMIFVACTLSKRLGMILASSLSQEKCVSLKDHYWALFGIRH
jgi:hypothetical protein